jgi:hypothetical protein
MLSRQRASAGKTSLKPLGVTGSINAFSHKIRSGAAQRHLQQSVTKLPLRFTLSQYSDGVQRPTLALRKRHKAEARRQSGGSSVLLIQINRSTEAIR